MRFGSRAVSCATIVSMRELASSSVAFSDARPAGRISSPSMSVRSTTDSTSSARVAQHVEQARFAGDAEACG